MAIVAELPRESSLGKQAHRSVVESVRAECSRWLLPVDMGSGVVQAVCDSIIAKGDWRPFDALMGKLDAHSSRYHALCTTGLGYA